MGQKILMRVENFSTGYDGKHVVEGANFSLFAGEALVVLGPNGAGKSTLLKGVAGLLPVLGGRVYYRDLDEKRKVSREPNCPTRGSQCQNSEQPKLILKDEPNYPIGASLCQNSEQPQATRIDGSDVRQTYANSENENESGVEDSWREREISDMSPELLSKKRAVLFTERPRLEYMNCRELVSAGRYPYTGRFGILSERDEAFIVKAMERMDVLNLSEKPFRSLSDGQKQRILLARALCQDPEILILDEPASFLDIRSQIELSDLLRSLVEEDGLGIILSLHELGPARRIADRCMAMKRGHIDRIGLAEEVLKEEYLESLFDIRRGALRRYQAGSIQKHV